MAKKSQKYSSLLKRLRRSRMIRRGGDGECSNREVLKRQMVCDPLRVAVGADGQLLKGSWEKLQNTNFKCALKANRGVNNTCLNGWGPENCDVHGMGSDLEDPFEKITYGTNCLDTVEDEPTAEETKEVVKRQKVCRDNLIPVDLNGQMLRGSYGKLQGTNFRCASKVNRGTNNTCANGWGQPREDGTLDCDVHGMVSDLEDPYELEKTGGRRRMNRRFSRRLK